MVYNNIYHWKSPMVHDVQALGENWDNSEYIGPTQIEIMNYVKNNAANMEFGITGVLHEYWEEGVKYTNTPFATIHGLNHPSKPLHMMKKKYCISHGKGKEYTGRKRNYFSEVLIKQ